MPLHDVSYPRYLGARDGRLQRCWALARSELRSLLKQRRFLFLLAVAWVPAIVRAGQIYAARQFPRALPFFEVEPRLWAQFLSQQVSLLLLVAVALYAGSGSIASDVRFGALTLYLSKPISRMDYLVGKTLSVLVPLLAITLVPAAGLLVFHLSLAEDMTLLQQAPWLPLSIAGYSLCVGFHFTLTVLAVSSLTRSRRLAAAGFVILAFGSHFVAEMASRMTFGGHPSWVSLLGAATDAAGFFFGGSEGPAGRPLTSLAGMVFWMGLSLVVIDRRLRSTEVVS